MPINVTCPGCKKRFSVSEKFAGQQGPCPQCKTVISIPKLEDEVVVHAPQAAGPVDSTGKAVSAPILREETRFSPLIAGLLGGAAVLVIVLTVVVGRSYDGEVPWFWQALAAVALAPPLVAAGYTFLRNDELEPHRGRELLIRALACGAAYAFLWGAYAYVEVVLERDFDVYQLVFILPPIVLAGGFAAFASLDLDYGSGLIHYSLYLVATVLLRLLAGMPAF